MQSFIFNSVIEKAITYHLEIARNQPDIEVNCIRSLQTREKPLIPYVTTSRYQV